MSLDFYLQQDYCIHCKRGGDIIFDINFTHNVTNMWQKAGCYEALYNSEGKQAKEVIQELEQALADFCINFPEFQKLDSPNGWGTAKHAVGFLYKVWDYCRKYPEAYIHISK